MGNMQPIVKINKTKTIETRCEYRLDDIALKNLLSDYIQERIPDHASVTINIPGGGDYSNMTLDVTQKTPVVIKWKETESE